MYVGVVLVVLVGDLADEFLGEVLDGDDTGEPAVLVDDAGELVARLPQLPQHVRQPRERRDDERGPHDAGHRRTVLLLRGEEVGEVDDAQDVARARREDRVARVADGHERADETEVGGLVDGVDARTRDHRVLDVLLREVEDAVEQDGQVVGQVTALAGLLDDRLEVLRRRGVLDVVDGFDLQRAQQGVGGLVEEPDEPAEHLEVGQRGTAQPRRHRFGLGDGEVLREQLAEQHLDERGEHERHDATDGDPDPAGDADAAQERPEGLPDERFGDVPDEQARDGDAELGSGEHEGGAARDRERAFGARVTGLGTGPRPERSTDM